MSVDFIEVLSRPARELDLDDADESPALQASRAAARRGRLGSLTTRIEQMHATDDRSLSAIRQRFMPHSKGRVDTPQQVSRRLDRPTYELTAAFVRAFYPWFGADTTAEHVRKSL